MYEDITYEEILSRMLNKVPPNIDKREGGIIYDSLAPVAMECQNMYISLDIFLDECFADSASFEYLIRRSGERSLSPDEASNAVLKGVFNCNVPIGSRFSLNDQDYIATEQIVDKEYKLRCETLGSNGNRHFGTLIPIGFIDGLESAELTELLIPGEDEEEEEHFRLKYFSSFDTKSFGGNRADYKEKIDGISGVGGVKVARRQANDKYIRICISDSLYGVPSAELISLVQTTIDPEQNHGEGDGLAPIGHNVLISGVEGFFINIESTLIFDSANTAELLKEQMEAAVDSYFLELSKTWETIEAITVRVSQIEARLLSITGILDATDTTLNGDASNIVLKSNQIPKRGDILVS